MIATPARRQNPLPHCSRARDAVRAAARDQPVTVWLRGGTYYLGAPVEFGPEDSGTAEHPITYAAMPGEEPIISGGWPITGWTAAESGPLDRGDSRGEGG